MTEIKSSAARIIIDMGASLSPEQAESDASLRIDGVTCGEPDCDGVLITHCHGDHVGLFESVLLQIPIYTGSVAKRIYKLVQQTVKDKLGKGSPERVETFKEYAAGQPLYFKDIKVTPYCIDHSAFDAYMFLIECGGKRILHTGDIRMHGARGRKMPYVFQKYARNIDALIIEGTMLSRQGEKVKTMHELGRDAEKLLKDSKNVFVLCSSRHRRNCGILCRRGKSPQTLCRMRKRLSSGNSAYRDKHGDIVVLRFRKAQGVRLRK